MIKEKVIVMLVGIFVLLLACSERDENESLIDNAIMGNDKVNVSLTLSPLPQVQIEGNTDYRPMSTRAHGDSVLTVVEKGYKCLVLKEIDKIWYVDAVLDRFLKPGKPWDTIKVREHTVFDDLELTLRPGHYQVLVVLNSRLTTWNENLVPGVVVKDETGTITHACTYWFQNDNRYANYKERQMSKEVFAGTADFTVAKTPDLHSPVAINGNTQITFVRKVSKLRFIFKDNPAFTKPFDYNFSNTQYTIHSTVKVSQKGEYFCDGLDCFGKPYYNRANPTTQMRIITGIDMDWQMKEDGRKYMLSTPNATIYFPFLFADTAKVVHFQLEDVLITGKSELPSIQYVYAGPVTELTLKNDSTQSVVFQATTEVEHKDDIVEVTLEHLPSDSSEKLFGDFYEYNYKP